MEKDKVIFYLIVTIIVLLTTGIYYYPYLRSTPCVENYEKLTKNCLPGSYILVCHRFDDTLGLTCVDLGPKIVIDNNFFTEKFEKDKRKENQ